MSNIEDHSSMGRVERWEYMLKYHASELSPVTKAIYSICIAVFKGVPNGSYDLAEILEDGVGVKTDTSVEIKPAVTDFIKVYFARLLELARKAVKENSNSPLSVTDWN